LGNNSPSWTITVVLIAALLGAAVLGALIGAVAFSSTHWDKGVPYTIQAGPAAEQAIAAPFTLADGRIATCPDGWDSQGTGWQLREDGFTYLSCYADDVNGAKWNVVYVSDQTKVLTRYAGAELVQYVERADGTGDKVDVLVDAIR
jgi:hypothetical protein